MATRQVTECITQALEQAGLTVDDIDLFVLHQANRRNMSSAAIPVLFDELNRCGIIKRTHKIVLSGFGAGLTYGACVIKW